MVPYYIRITFRIVYVECVNDIHIKSAQYVSIHQSDYTEQAIYINIQCFVLEMFTLYAYIHLMNNGISINIVHFGGNSHSHQRKQFDALQLSAEKRCAAHIRHRNVTVNESI